MQKITSVTHRRDSCVCHIWQVSGSHQRVRDFKKCKVCLVAELLGSSPALNQVNDEDDDSNYQQEVDQAAANVAEQAKKPEH